MHTHTYVHTQDHVPELDVVVLGGFFRKGDIWSGMPTRFLVGVAASEPADHADSQSEDDAKVVLSQNGAKEGLEGEGGEGMMTQTQTQTQVGELGGKGVWGGCL